jgi:hypothetical protein
MKDRIHLQRFRRNLPAIGGVGMAWLILLNAGWMKWGHILIDTWRDPYVVKRMVEDGIALYTGTVYEFGFLAPHVLAAVARVGGAGPMTFVGAGIAISLAMTALLYRIARFFIPRVWAASAVVSFLIVCVFRSFDPYDLGGYILPYTFAATMFMTAVTAAVYAAIRWMLKGDSRFLWGACLSIAVAGWSRPVMTIAIGLVIVAFWLMQSLRPVRLPVRVAGVLLPAVVCVAGWLVYFLLNPGAGEYWRIIRGQGSASFFYLNMLGVTSLGHNLALAGCVGLCYVLVLAGLTAAGRMFDAGNRIGGYVLSVSVPAGGLFFLLRFMPYAVFMSLPLLLIVALYVCFRRYKARIVPLEAAKALLYACGLMLLLRVFFKVYPPVSPMASTYLPLGLIGFWALWYDFVPKRMARGGLVFMALLLLPWLQTDLVGYTARSVHYRTPRTGQDLYFWDDPSTGVFTGFLTWASTDMPAESTMFVVPEGIGLNYLTGIRNPLPYYHANPTFINTFGEDTFIAALASARPDCIVHVNRITHDFGAPFFGRDYGRLMYQWIRDNYVVEKVFGTDEFDWNNFGIVVYKRRI